MLQKLPPDSKTCVIFLMERTLKDLTASLIKGIRISILVRTEDLEVGSCPELSHYFSRDAYKTRIMHSLVHMVANEINTAFLKEQMSEPANSYVFTGFNDYWLRDCYGSIYFLLQVEEII